MAATLGMLMTPAGASAQTARTAKAPAIKITDTRLDVTTGRRAFVRGSVPGASAGRLVLLQIRRNGTWRSIDRDRTGREGRYRLGVRYRTPRTVPLRVRTGRANRRLRPLNVYRLANASWYGPGFFGNRTACGSRLHPGTVGVAHKWLPCGTRVTFRRSGRELTVPVIDRGPYVGGREYDLTQAVAQRLGFRGHGAILSTR